MWLWVIRLLNGIGCGGRPAGGRGAEGEAIAERHLRAKGYRILAKNWRNPADRREEIDLVAMDQDVWVLVEVKTRSASAKVPGYYSVNRAKKAVLLRAARAYFKGLSNWPKTFRMDVVEVSTDGQKADVRHFENVPLFPKNWCG